MKRPIIVLCIDRDNDLFDKGGVPGPLIGREKNLQGAISLSLADPEDPDSNAMFYAIKLYDQLNKEGNAVEVVTLTGDRKLGVTADRIVSAQLDRVLLELNPTSCILVSDGVADEEVLPIIKSRIKVDSTKIVFIKQAKELEKTYFVVLEKLKDPYFARTIIGVPAILLLLISLSSFFGLGWQPIGVLIGIYLVLKIMGFEDMILDFISDFRFSFERAS
jgi:putative membrane protein